MTTDLKEKAPLGKIIVITSGKGGVGKTTSAAAISAGLAKLGHKTVVIDFDVGLRNLDMIMGCERRVVFDFINVIQGDAKLKQALIKDKRLDTLYVLPTSQTRDKDALTTEGVEAVLNELREEFDYIICDSPAGIERGAQMAMYFADEAIVVTITPTYSGCPAMQVMTEDIAATLRQAGYDNFRISTRLAPAWTTDWLSELGRQQLRLYGIAPPRKEKPIHCPRCDATDIRLISQFGSTPCKALYQCRNCAEPFDYFKPI